MACRALFPAALLFWCLALTVSARATAETTITLGASVAAATSTAPNSDYIVTPRQTTDEKAVFATIESANIIPARARIGGTIIDLKVRQGDKVERDQIIATVGDEKIGLQAQSQNAQVRAAQAQVEQTRADLDRAQKLVRDGYATKANVEKLRTDYNVALNNLKTQNAQQSVIQQQETEGKVLAPAAGRILSVPVTRGTVIMPGESVATIAEQNYILRLNVPERHAAFIKAGDKVRVDSGTPGQPGQSATIKLVYPKIENGRLQADATLAGLGDYFVGERVRVWVSTGQRTALIIPATLVLTQNGIDYVRLRQSDSKTMLVPVQRGQTIIAPGQPTEIEILSGLKEGDRLVAP